ncbi:unnamed protein product [Coregonus sp. 'balchen']|nr:unnamed protein product [Coregonus sp. 'balchen']
MYGVREESGRVVRDTEEMVKVTTEHFQGFFQERAVDVEQGNVFLEHLSQQVPEDIRKAMEVESALRRMGKGKVPGMDGLDAELEQAHRSGAEEGGDVEGKVLVLKVDVLPSLLYMAYVYPLPESLRVPLVRLVFQFMWGCKQEYVARVRMLCPIGEGGRGVPHFTLKQDSIFVSYLLTELAHPVIHPSGYLLRVFFSYQARSVMVWTNTGPRAEQLPSHFGYAAKWLRGHPEVEVARVGLDHRHLYEEVRRGGCPGPVLGIPAVVWEGVQVRGLDNRLKNLNWLSLHKGLPVRSILYGRGLTRSPTCPRPTYGGEETVRHVFWDCAFAGVVWARAQGLIGRAEIGKDRGRRGCGGDSEEGGEKFEGEDEGRGEEVGAACCSGEVERGFRIIVEGGV